MTIKATHLGRHSGAGSTAGEPAIRAGADPDTAEPSGKPGKLSTPKNYTTTTTDYEAILNGVEKGKDFNAASFWGHAEGADAPTTSGLHKEVISFISLYSLSRGVPTDFVIPSMLAAAAAAAGNSVEIRGGGYVNKPNLFIAIIADSGSNKSTAMAELLRPLQDIDNRLRNAYAAERQRYNEARAAPSKGKKKGGEEQPLPDPPKRQALILRDVTEEARMLYLNDCERGILQYVDELGAMLGNLGRYTKSGASPEQTSLMSIYDGRPSPVDRIGREPLKVANPYYTLIGSIQKDAVTEQLATKRAYSIGFTPRFLIFEPTELKYSGELLKNSAELEVALMEWGGWIENIWRSADPGRPRTLTLTRGAEEVAAAFYREAADIQNSEDNSAIRAVVSKLRIVLWRLAGCAHLLNEAASGVKESVIKTEEMKWAADICRYAYRRHLRQLERISEQERLKQEQKPPTIKDAVLALAAALPEISREGLSELLNKALPTEKAVTPNRICQWISRDKKASR